MTFPKLDPTQSRLNPQSFCRCGTQLKWTGDMYIEGFTQLYKLVCPKDCTGFIAWVGYQEQPETIVTHDYNEAQQCPQCKRRSGSINDIIRGYQDNGEFSITLYTCEWCGHNWDDSGE